MTIRYTPFIVALFGAILRRRCCQGMWLRNSCRPPVVILEEAAEALWTWVRSHEGLIPWVRALVGRAMPGWQSYSSWAYASVAVTAEYLRDEKLRISYVKRKTDKELSALQGIQQIRDELRQARRVVRLLGLSGVGKTRLVQALFDERVGEQSLDSSLAN
jgi:hypothetical protein